MFGNAAAAAFPKNLNFFLLKFNMVCMFWIFLMCWCQKWFLKNEKNIIGIYFNTKSYLKSTRNQTAKHTLNIVPNRQTEMVNTWYGVRTNVDHDALQYLEGPYLSSVNSARIRSRNDLERKLQGWIRTLEAPEKRFPSLSFPFTRIS